MKTVQLILALHNHQPVGNFPDVFAKACRMAYDPLLDMLDEFPQIRAVLHYSGPLWEYAEQHDRRLVERVVSGCHAGRFELMGSGYGEPVLSMLATGDAIGQVRMYHERLRRRYDVKTRGVWLTERIWEQAMAGTLADAGVEYTVLDDFHYKVVGLRDPDLTGYYVTEDRGRILKLFAGSEFLRYAIPFRDPPDTIEYLRRFATEEGRNVLVYGDDGEKFGLWPQTYEHVYERGWLRRFLQLLYDNRDWIHFTTFSDVLDSQPPKGKIYLSDCSYREMTEWALLTPAQLELDRVMDRLKQCNVVDAVRPFMRGGPWRNFKVKFVEGAQMYARQMEVSRLLADRGAAKNADEARQHLYFGQCNCAYWHGVFGGLYLPFLRWAIYNELLQAENLLSTDRGRPGRAVEDFDLDGRPEVKLHSAGLAAYLKPDRGGTLYELDDRERAWNLTSVMTRRFEAYHHRFTEAIRTGQLAIVKPDSPVQSIHAEVRAKEPDLERLLQYDPAVRESLMDHFYPADTTPERLRCVEAPEWGDFIGAPYDLDIPPSRASLVTLKRRGRAGPPDRRVPIDLAKRVSLDGTRLEIRYVLGFPEGAPADTIFSVEFNFGLMAGNAPDRNYFTPSRENLGNLSTRLARNGEAALGLVDEWLGVEIWIHADPAAGFWTYPVETVNDSEGGFERVYQSSAVLPYWRLSAQSGEERVFTLTVEVRHR